MRQSRRNLKRSMDWSTIAAIALRVNKQVTRHGANCALIGGGAMQFYGSDRLTFDVDVAADAEVPLDQTILGPLEFDGTPGGWRYQFADVPTDFIVRQDGYAALYADAVARADEIEEGFRIVTPEHLAIIKLAAGRTKDSDDLVFLLRQPELVDRKAAAKIARRFLGQFGAEEFESACVLADVQEAHDQRKRDFRPPNE